MHINLVSGRILSAFFISVFFLFSAGLAAQGIPDEHTMDQKTQILVPGTRVSITLPDVFTYNSESQAYVYTGAAASIFVKELPGTSYTSLSAATSAKTFEAQGMQMTESLNVITMKGIPGIIYKVRLTAISAGNQEEVEFERLIFFAGNETSSVWVTVSYPLMTAGLLSDVLHESLLSIEF